MSSFLHQHPFRGTVGVIVMLLAVADVLRVMVT